MSDSKCTYELSETQSQFKNPKLKKKTATRASRFEEFLWKELYDEYLRYNDRLNNVKFTANISEYVDKYHKDMPPEDEAAKEALSNRYPLYCTHAITLWNHDGDITKDFKKRYLITRPVQDQEEQFG